MIGLSLIFYMAIIEITISSGIQLECDGSAACFRGNVTRIVDGDTLDVNGIRIRLSLVNAPETGQEHYTEAKRLAELLCPIGNPALVDQDDGQRGGSYCRMIGEVHCNYDHHNENNNNSSNLAEQLLKSGFANILTKHCIDSEFANKTWAKEFGC
jgi:endonuclease YncB( thermonuclease family)